MNLTIYPPLALYEQGERDNNEDYIYPPVGQATEADRLFVVCDGMGGLAKGEEASRLVAGAIAEAFQSEPGSSTEVTVALALQQAERVIEAYLRTHPDAKGMGTTLTLLHLHERGATVAHVGDSRVYHVRAGKILFRTNDHKLVNEWVKSGVLTPEQATDHPQRNVITRAVQGRVTQPAQADVQCLPDLRTDDYFLLCTDGLLEQLTDEALVNILSTGETDEAKLAAIRTLCKGRTSDNFSAYLIHIRTAEGESHPVPTVRASAGVSTPSSSTLTVLPTVPIPAAHAEVNKVASIPGSQPALATKPLPPPKPKLWWQIPLNWVFLGVVLGVIFWQLISWSSHRKPGIVPIEKPAISPNPLPHSPHKPR